MMREGPWFLTRAALADFARIARGSRQELEEHVAAAHFVKVADSGAEIWRGPAPLRLRLIVSTGAGVGGGAPQLVRVEGAHRGQRRALARRVRLWDGARYRELLVEDEVHEEPPGRRVAYRLSSGHWVSGIRGRLSPDHVIELTAPLSHLPRWVAELRARGR
jgi:hypothetical protein